MYLVTIINNNIETVINHVSTNNKSNRISGTIKQGINCINSFTFTIYPSNEGYNLINPLSTLVKVLNTKTGKYEFIGRVLSPKYSMSSSGLVSKSYVCESELAYLLDTYQSYEEIHNISVKGYLERLIQVHNANTNDNKKFTVGNVDVVDNNDSLYKYIAYDRTKKNIDDDLIGKLGGELQIRYENGVRYLDYLTEIGQVCSTEIRLAKNLKDITQDIDFNGYCNRLIVLGAKLKTEDEEGNEVDSEKRLTIESINNGIRYIDDVESIEQYGIIQGQVIYDDVTEAKNLLVKGQKYLLNQRILISNKVNALDLSLIGIDIDSFEVGNYYPLIHEILGINDTVRIVEKSISIDKPHTSTITLGDLEKDIKRYNIQVKKGYEEAKKLADEAKKKAIQVEKYTTNEIYRVDDRVNQVTVDTNNKFNDVNNELDSVKNEISDIKNNNYIFDINNKATDSYKESLSLSDITVMQSFDIELDRNEIYFAQLKSGTKGDIILTKINTANNSILGTMTLENFGHATNICIEEDGADTYIWTECDGIADTNGEKWGSKICRFEFSNGTTFTNNTGTVYDLLTGHTNLSPSIDKLGNTLLIRSRKDGKVFFTVFNLNSVLINKPIIISQFENPSGVNVVSHQGHDIYKNYIYNFEGVSKNDERESAAYITVMDIKGNVKYRQLVTIASTLDFREAEGIKVKQVNLTTHELYIGFASGVTGGRKANIYKYIDITQ